jgi:hypothetical protein
MVTTDIKVIPAYSSAADKKFIGSNLNRNILNTNELGFCPKIWGQSSPNPGKKTLPL